MPATPTVGNHLDVAVTTNIATATIDITTATTGNWVYLFVTIVGAVSVAPSCTGWTTVTTDSPNLRIFRRKKVGGDTTFTVNWTGASNAMLSWVEWTNLDPTTPDESAASTDQSGTSRTAVPTPSASPTSTGRYAVGYFSTRASVVGNKNITWTPDAALTEILDANGSAGSVNSWVGHEVAWSVTPVTNASHTYTGTHNLAETRDFSAILYLIPAPSNNSQAGFFAAYLKTGASDVHIDYFDRFLRQYDEVSQRLDQNELHCHGIDARVWSAGS
jgi:hypothetical protein